MKTSTKILFILMLFSAVIQSASLSRSDVLSPEVVSLALIESIFGSQLKTAKIVLEDSRTDVNYELILRKYTFEESAYDCKETIELLAQSGIVIDKPDEYGHTPLKLAALKGDSDMVELLIQHKADINRGDVLTSALCANKQDIVKLLVQRNADINRLGLNGHTPLKWAACRKNQEMIKLLLQHDADIDGKSSDGYGALGFSVFQRDPETTRLLLENRADPNSRGTNSKGGKCRTPLEIAEYQGFSEIVELLRGEPDADGAE